MASLLALVVELIEWVFPLSVAAAREICDSPNQKPLDAGSKILVLVLLGLAVALLFLTFYLLSRA